MSNIASLILIGTIMFGTLGAVTLLSHIYSLNNIKSRTVGDGQHGTARWATNAQIKKTYKHLPFTPERWRRQVQKDKTATTPDGKELPQGIVVGSTGRAGKTTVMVDTDDVHALMIGAAGVGKTAYWLYPCIEYACASGMSFLSIDTKGDVMRNYGTIAKEYYEYQISVIDLRNPTRSNGNNLLHLVNKYMDLYQRNPSELTYKAKAEKYAKIISKTIILSGADSSSFGQNAYLYDAAEGLLTATILLVAEFCEPGKRHIVSVFKIIQELLAPSQKKGKNQFQQLMEIIQQLYREILAVADEMGGKLKNRCVFFCDEFGTLPKIESAEMMFSASRSRRLQIVPIVQSFSQLEKNYGKEGAEIIIDNTQLTIFGGFAPNSTSAEVLSKSLGSRTVMSGSVSRGKNDPSQSLQMIERPLMTPDELKSMPKGQFVVMKTGFYPMKVKLKLFFKWGIQFEQEYAVTEHGNRKVAYAEKQEIIDGIRSKYQPEWMEEVEIPPSAYPIGGQQQTRTQLRTSPKTYREVNRNG